MTHHQALNIIWRNSERLQRIGALYLGPDDPSPDSTDAPVRSGFAGPNGMTEYTVSIAECMDALHHCAVRNRRQLADIAPVSVDPHDVLAVYHWPQRTPNNGPDAFECTRDEMMYWDPFSPDDGWPGYDDGTSRVSPLLPLSEVMSSLVHVAPDCGGGSTYR